jgi:putative oxidoreductase
MIPVGYGATLASEMRKLLHSNEYPGLLIRLAVGLVFLSEGLQKFLYPEILGSGRFQKLGIHPAAFWAPFTGSFEIICAGLIIIGYFTRLATIPLLIIMVVAFITTKWPLLLDKGLWPMLHEGRTDFVLTMLLVFLLIYGSGHRYLDFIRYAKGKG